jgi:hypothetical protein
MQEAALSNGLLIYNCTAVVSLSLVARRPQITCRMEHHFPPRRNSKINKMRISVPYAPKPIEIWLRNTFHLIFVVGLCEM